MPPRRGSKQPNVILLVLDALRADALEPYGAPVGSSPMLAALARRGLAVPEVRATASWTLPSHTAMFTGQLARGLGLGQAPAQTPQSAAPIVREQRDRLLAEILRRSGYATRGVTTNVWAGKRSGFDTGFDEFTELDSSRQSELGGGLGRRLRWDWEAMRARGDDGAVEAERSMREWLGRLDGRPFFWFANVVECHSPYLPPRKYAAGSALTRLRAADDAFRFLSFEAIMRSCVGTLTVPTGAIDRMRTLYAASVRYVDHWIGRLETSLATAGVLDDTLLIVCSDHGENFGEEGLMTHGLALNDSLLRVPFLAAGPGASEFEDMSSLAQLPARIAAATGLESHPWTDRLPGGLPVAQWDPFPLTDEQRSKLCDRLGVGEREIWRLTSPLTSAVSGTLKLLRGQRAEDEVLYDLSRDPHERTPLRSEEAMRATGARQLSELRGAVEHPAVQATAGAPPPPEDAVSADETADIERRLRLMGYM